jgi:hypothetical protein
VEAVLLADLLHPTVQVPDVRIGDLDLLPRQGEDDPQHAVRRGMRRAHVEDEGLAREVLGPGRQLDARPGSVVSAMLSLS